MRSADPRELDVEEVVAEYRRRIALACPSNLDFAIEVAARLDPEHWRLEWSLPWWLAEAFGLRLALARRLVLCNLLGLVSVRLQDDIDDGDIVGDNVARARELAAAAYREALSVYRERFDETSPFWPFLDESMASWRAGANGSDAPSRGTPIKIGAYAVALLADRLDVWPALDRCLDHSLAALVLYDQFCDWEADLEAGRWNAFVAIISPNEQSHGLRVRNRAVVLTAMLTSSVVTDHFEHIDAEAKAAASLAAELEIMPLQAHLTEWASRTAAQGADIAVHYRTVADQATELMFGTAIPAGEGGAR